MTPSQLTEGFSLHKITRTPGKFDLMLAVFEGKEVMLSAGSQWTYIVEITSWERLGSSNGIARGTIKTDFDPHLHPAMRQARWAGRKFELPLDFRKAGGNMLKILPAS